MADTDGLPTVTVPVTVLEGFVGEIFTHAGCARDLGLHPPALAKA